MNRNSRPLWQRCALKAIVALAPASTTPPAFAGTVYYVDLVNNAASDVVAFEVARADSAHYHPVLHGGVLPRGKTATVTIRVGDDGCLRDLRMRFADGHVGTYGRFDICRDWHDREVGSGPQRVVFVIDGSSQNDG